MNNYFLHILRLLDKLDYDSEMKITKEQGVEAHSARNTSRLEGRAGAPR
jgi:hypothetical protein